MDGEEYIMDTSWLDIMVTELLLRDKSLQQIPGSGTSNIDYGFYTVEAKCGYFSCSDRELTCVVCIK